LEVVIRRHVNVPIYVAFPVGKIRLQTTTTHQLRGPPLSSTKRLQFPFSYLRNDEKMKIAAVLALFVVSAAAFNAPQFATRAVGAKKPAAKKAAAKAVNVSVSSSRMADAEHSIESSIYVQYCFCSQVL
jgi:hypothetical protein